MPISCLPSHNLNNVRFSVGEALLACLSPRARKDEQTCNFCVFPGLAHVFRSPINASLEPASEISAGSEGPNITHSVAQAYRQDNRAPPGSSFAAKPGIRRKRAEQLIAIKSMRLTITVQAAFALELTSYDRSHGRSGGLEFMQCGLTRQILLTGPHFERMGVARAKSPDITVGSRQGQSCRKTATQSFRSKGSA